MPRWDQAPRGRRKRRRRMRRERGLAVLLVVVVVVGLLSLAAGVATRRTTGDRVRRADAGPPRAVRRRASPHRPAASPATRADREARRLAAIGLPVFCGGHRGRMVALTFDDGPGVYTHYAVSLLSAAHRRATFFLVGRSIAGWPGWAQREERLGAFGDHTMTHPFLPGLPLSTAVDQIVAARRLIAGTVHHPIVLFRPPYGSHTPAIDAAVRRLGMVEVLWNVDSGDSLGADYLGIEHNVIAGLTPGSIILMHENRGQTIRALPVIFAALRARHLQAVTVPRLLAEDPPSLAQLRRGESGCPVRSAAGGGS